MKYSIRILVLCFAVLKLSALAATGDIVGNWKGLIIAGPQSTLTVKFEITKNETGAYAIAVSSYVKNNVQKYQADSVAYDAGKLSMKIQEMNASYEGNFKDGVIAGQWKLEGASLPLALFPYNEPRLSEGDMNRLQGSWNGEINMGMSLAVVFRFAVTPQGEFVGFADSPEQNGYGIPISDIQVKDNELTVKIAAMKVEFKGQITDNSISGKFKQTGPTGMSKTSSLILAKGEYKATDLPNDIVDLLIGEWSGAFQIQTDKMIIVTTTFRFTKNEKGDLTGILTVRDPTQQFNRPIIAAKMNNGKITLKAAGIGEYNGQIVNDKIKGEWKQGPETYPLSLKKNKG
jgi:hypothetical protein